MTDDLRNRLERRPTDELVEIFVAHDEDEWRPEVFPLVEAILVARGVDLAAATASPAEDESEEKDESGDLEVVATFHDALRASLCRSALGAAGIEAWLSTENVAGIAPHLGIALGIQVQVRPEDLEAAAEVLRSVESGSAAIPEDAEPCPRCSSMETEHRASPDRAGALLGQLVMGLPRPDAIWTWTCKACGHEWR